MGGTFNGMDVSSRGYTKLSVHRHERAASILNEGRAVNDEMILPLRALKLKFL